MPGILFDPMLGQMAATVDDLEGQRKAAENRLRIFTKADADEDGEERGFGLPADHPSVISQAAVVDLIKDAEKLAVKNLEKAMKAHPLGPWVQNQKGLGLKTIARLLAEIGDPYWMTRYAPDPDNPEKNVLMEERPRTVSELWAFCGLHVVDGAAPKRQKGYQSNWRTMAKTRAYNTLDPIVKLKNNPERGKYADLFYAEKDRLAGRTYGPGYYGRKLKGDIIGPDTPIPPGHAMAMAKRKVMKELLKDLWIESARLYEVRMAA